jgi:hypothetical protein
MKRFTIAMLMIGTCAMLLSGCAKKETKAPAKESITHETETQKATTAVKPTKPSGINLLTGEPMDNAVASKRPLAIMLGNTADALPQYDLGQADVLYEVPVEGGLTRLMAIFQDYSKLDKLGSVRSCRHYFAYYALEFDAIYMHYGQAAWAEELLGSGLISDLNGLDSKVNDLAFYRDPDRKTPHNAFTTSDGIQKAIEYKQYDTQYKPDYLGHYTFAKDANSVNLTAGTDAAVVRPGYVTDKPWFVYKSKDGQYYRFQYKQEHIDGATNEQLKYKNIIFQYSDYVMEPDNKYLDVKTVGTGAGKFITNGKAIDITWKKADQNSPAKYYDASGKEITLNQGKTCVCVVLNDAVSKVGIFATEADFQAAQ